MVTRRTVAKILTGGTATFGVPTLAAHSADAAAPRSGGAAGAQPPVNPLPDLGPLESARTELLDIAYHVAGPVHGQPVILGHGWPYSPNSYRDVMPSLAAHGFRVFVPYLRGFGPTRFRSSETFRSGEQAAIGQDLIDFMDALGIRRAIMAGYDWGGRGACVAAALWPHRCDGLVSANSYLIQDLSPAAVNTPAPPSVEEVRFYFYWFLTERGAVALTNSRKDIAGVVWAGNSPNWKFSPSELDTVAAVFDNPDYVDVVLHSYRHRLLAAAGDPRYAGLEKRLRTLPPITVPAVTLDGLDDASTPATDGTSSAVHFTGPRVHHQVAGAGHNIPEEAPAAFVDAIVEVSGLR